MQFTQESKSQLAKLMASENIRVEHQKIQTAMFDLKNRTLYCPIWENMSGELYDLLLGHEVGHALETPEEGWHNAVMGTGKFNKNFKHFLNVVEDARIEKKIKRRYPGLRPSFVKAYQSLIEKDFFGIKNRKIDEMPFIDRLNLYTKGGVNQGITFTDEEQILVSQVESCETWEDVVRVTGAIYDYSKDEQKELMQEQMKKISSSFEEMEDSDFGEDYDFDDYGDEEGEELEESSDISNKSRESDDADGEQQSFENDEYVLNRFKESSPFPGSDNYEPVCITDEEFRKNELKLLSKESRDYVYVDVPKPILNKIVTPYKRVHELMDACWTHEEIQQKISEYYTEFKNKNDRYIGLLAKEFEMRKSASKFSKQKISETGDIDVNRIYKYQIEDNLFRKLTKVPKGKSHGIVIMFDRSGSMVNCMKHTLEQVLILTSFCRKVNIPFVVYGFGNNVNCRNIDFPNEGMALNGFSSNDKELYLSHVYLREYLNSNMKASEYTRCMKNVLALSNSYGGRYSRTIFRPYSEELSNTPLIEAMVALEPLTNDFRKRNNLDIVNTVLIHDGDADNIHCYNLNKSYKIFNSEKQNVVLTDKKNKLQFDVEGDKLFESVLSWYSKVTDSKIIGFYITGNPYETREAICRRYHDENGKHIQELFENRFYEMKEKSKELQKIVRDNKHLESNNKGYSKFYFVPGDSNLAAEEYELDIQEGAKTSQIKKAFLKANVKKQISRVFVNKFIQQIAV